MTPEDLATVDQSWTHLRHYRGDLLAGLTRRFDGVAASTFPAERRAAWLLAAVEELVELLSAPSRLADRARDLGETWPDPLAAPCFEIEGRAWMGAACECAPNWTEHTEASWRQAWLLLSEVLAAETLSPFRDHPPQ